MQAINPTGSGPLSAPSNAVTPLTAVAPSAPTGVAAQAASQSAQVTLDGAGVRRRQPDHRLHDHAVHRRDRADAGVRPAPRRRSATVTRPDQRHELHVQGHRHQRASATSPASAASNAVTPQATIFDFATPGDRRLGRHRRSVELGVKFKADYNGTITGVRFYKAAANTGTHIGSLWSAAGTRLAQATFTRRDRLRLADA